MKNIGRSSSVIPFLMTALAALKPAGPSGKVKILSHKIEQKEETKYEWAKRTQQKMKGKGARMNRGRNRQPKSQNIPLYAMLGK